MSTKQERGATAAGLILAAIMISPTVPSIINSLENTGPADTGPGSQSQIQSAPQGEHVTLNAQFKKANNPADPNGAFGSLHQATPQGSGPETITQGIREGLHTPVSMRTTARQVVIKL